MLTDGEHTVSGDGEAEKPVRRLSLSLGERWRWLGLA